MRRLRLHFSLFALVVFAAAANAADAPAVFVQKNIRWQKTPHGYEAGNGAIVLLAADHHLLELFTQLYREKKDRSISIDLKSGYLVRVGKWTPNADGELEVRSRIVDSYKYFQMGGSKPDTETTEIWKISGEPFGPVKRKIENGKDSFEPCQRFRSTQRVMEFWSRLVTSK
jgi:hypothetical protein